MPQHHYHLAKVEHYLTRAEECLQMARYADTLKAVEKILYLDPGNSAAQSLKKRVEFVLTRIDHMGENGKAGEPSEKSNHRSRDQLVMIIDQDERILCRLTSELKGYGYEVISATGTGEAMELLATITPDIVISEITFENGPLGFDLFLWIRSNSLLRDIPFIFLATRIDRETMIAGKRMGVQDFISKPLDTELVVASTINSLSRQKITSL